MEKDIIKKQKSHAFKKDIYLLGEDEQGIKYWLEAPSWDCEWYWGFGFVETYTNNNDPSIAKDINSHQHIRGFIGAQKKGEYINNLFDNPTFVKTTFIEDEGWTLTELFNTFYTLQKTAGIFNRGGSGTTTNPCQEILQNKELEDKINKELLPAIFKQIILILEPKN